MSLVRGNAICELSLLSSGSVDRAENLEILYERISIEVQRRGLHFNDLSEELNYELVSELDGEGDSQFQHIYVRLCGDVLVLATMMGYEPSDEDEVRQMLETMEPGSERVSIEAFSLLPAPKVFSNWSSAGEFVFFNGVS